MPCPRSDPKPISGVEFPSNGPLGDVIVAESDPLGRGWITVLKNLETYDIGVFCAPRSQHVVLLSTKVDTIAPHQLASRRAVVREGRPKPSAGFSTRPGRQHGATSR
jgi:hypothetical protein